MQYMAQLQPLIAQRTAPTGPGEVLTAEFLPARHLSQTAAARELEMPLNRFHEICRGRRAVTADTAVRLAATFDTSPQFWTNLQANVDLWKAAHKLQRRRRPRRRARR